MSYRIKLLKPHEGHKAGATIHVEMNEGLTLVTGKVAEWHPSIIEQLEAEAEPAPAAEGEAEGEPPPAGPAKRRR